MSSALTRFSRRHIRIRPGRTLLTLLSVVIGVAAVVAVDMFSQSIRRANEHMFEVVSGRSSLEITGPGNVTLPMSLLPEIEKIRGVESVVPLIQRPGVLFTGDTENNQRMRLYCLGVDPQRDAALRDYEILEGGRFVRSGDEAVLEHSFAENLDVKTGDEVRLLAGRGRHTLQVVGLLKTTAHARTSSGGLIYLPLDKAQKIFLGGRKEFETAQIVTSQELPVEPIMKEITPLLPPGFSVHPPANRAAVLQQTMHSTERGLEVSAIFIVLLGAFIVFNTFLMNVGERRQQLAILRAIGATRWQLGTVLLGEGLTLGLLGTLIGLVGGWSFSIFAAMFVSRLMEVDIPDPQFSIFAGFKASAFGMIMSVLGVMYPAWKAAQLTPLEGMRNIPQGDSPAGKITAAILGSFMVEAGLYILYKAFYGEYPIDSSTYAAVLLLIGLVLMASLLIEPVSEVLAHLMRYWWGPLAILAQRQINRHHTRTALTAGVLFISASTGLAMSFSILDAIKDIRDWYKQAIVGDFFVRTMLPDFATGLSADIPDEVGREIEAITGTQSIDAARFAKGKVNNVECIVAARRFPTPEDIAFDLVEGELKGLHQRLHNGEAAVSTVLAQKANLKLNSEFELQTSEGPKRIRVAAIINEYAFGGLAIWISMEHGQRLLGLEGVDAYVVRVQPGQVDHVQQELRDICRKHGLLLHSFRDIRDTIDGIIRGSDIGLWLLVGVGFVVASFGVVNTLTMNVLEQTRELALLRIVAMTRAQVRQLIFVQALLLGLLGLVPGVLFGCVVAYFMNWAATITLAHPIVFQFRPVVLLVIFFGGLTLVLLSALFPALRASRINILSALHFE